MEVALRLKSSAIDATRSPLLFTPPIPYFPVPLLCPQSCSFPICALISPQYKCYILRTQFDCFRQFCFEVRILFVAGCGCCIICVDDEERAPNPADLVFQKNNTNSGDTVDVVVLLKLAAVSPSLLCALVQKEANAATSFMAALEEEGLATGLYCSHFCE